MELRNEGKGVAPKRKSASAEIIAQCRIERTRGYLGKDAQSAQGCRKARDHGRGEYRRALGKGQNRAALADYRQIRLEGYAFRDIDDDVEASEPRLRGESVLDAQPFLQIEQTSMPFIVSAKGQIEDGRVDSALEYGFGEAEWGEIDGPELGVKPVVIETVERLRPNIPSRKARRTAFFIIAVAERTPLCQ